MDPRTRARCVFQRRGTTEMSLTLRSAQSVGLESADLTSLNTVESITLLWFKNQSHYTDTDREYTFKNVITKHQILNNLLSSHSFGTKGNIVRKTYKKKQFWKDNKVHKTFKVFTLSFYFSEIFWDPRFRLFIRTQVHKHFLLVFHTIQSTTNKIL